MLRNNRSDEGRNPISQARRRRQNDGMIRWLGAPLARHPKGAPVPRREGEVRGGPSGACDAQPAGL